MLVNAWPGLRHDCCAAPETMASQFNSRHSTLPGACRNSLEDYVILRNVRVEDSGLRCGEPSQMFFRKQPVLPGQNRPVPSQPAGNGAGRRPHGPQGLRGVPGGAQDRRTGGEPVARGGPARVGRRFKTPVEADGRLRLATWQGREPPSQRQRKGGVYRCPIDIRKRPACMAF